MECIFKVFPLVSSVVVSVVIPAGVATVVTVQGTEKSDAGNTERKKKDVWKLQKVGTLVSSVVLRLLHSLRV